MEGAKFAEHLAVFAEVCRLGSFSAVARRRSVTHSAIVRQIDALEADLGVKLLTRSTRALAPTGAGQLLLRRAQPVLDDLADIRAEVVALDGTVGGVLRIACLPTFGKRYVMPALSQLLSHHAALRVELDLTERLADPVVERLDVVIRAGHLADSSLIGIKLGTHECRLVASPLYLDRFGRPDSLHALAAHRLLDKIHGVDLLGWSGLLGSSTKEFASCHDVFRCDDFETLRAAALSGFGIGFLPGWVIGGDIIAGSLVELLPDIVRASEGQGGVYLLRALADPPAKVAAFIEALQRVIGSPPVWDRSDHKANPF